MAKTTADSGVTTANDDQGNLTFQAHGADKIELPSSEFIADARMTRDGDDLVLTTPDGQTATVEGYFSADPAPLLQSADGAVLTPNLVDSFSRSSSEFAANETANDESPVGAVEEVKGNATVTRADGTVETITIGTPIYQGDIIETDAKGAVNITFIDETSMAVSENARLAVDQYTFDPATESGTTNFSVLRGLFVFTSGLIGRDDPDDVKIDTPVGSIGIRGTIIAGDINPSGESKISVLEGAIVVTNGNMETTLSQQFETVRLGAFDKPMESMGVVPANDISSRFSSVSAVSPTLFTTINDSASEQKSQPGVNAEPPAQTNQDAPAASDKPQAIQTQPTPEASAPVEAPAQAVNTAPAATIEAAPAQTPVPVVIDSTIVNLNGTSSTLPTTSTIAGGTSAPVLTNTTGTSTGTVTGTATAAPPVSAAPITQPVVTGTNAPAALPIAPPAATQPPPSVIAGNGTPPATGTVTPTVPPTPAPLVLSYTNSGINDASNAGAVIGFITAGVAGATYTLNTTTNDYTLVTNGTGVNVVMTATGQARLDSGFALQQFDTINVTVSDGTQTATNSFTPVIVDANLPGQIDLDNLASNAFTAVQDTTDNWAGYTISAVGDINNDGFDDFVMSNANGVAGQNQTYTIFGGLGVLNDTSIPALAGRLNLTQNPSVLSTADFSGSVVAGIGDFNGDGIEDYVIGQSSNNTGGISGSGNAAIVSGANPSSFRLFGTGLFGAGSEAGASVDGIGDYNNDGYADVIIGAPGTDRALLVKGSDSTWGSTLNANTLQINGSGGTDFGRKVAGIGDFNGDGYSDFAVGAPGAGGSNNGTVTIYNGNLNTATTSSFTITGGANDAIGQKLEYLGDINGDGLSDIMIGGDGRFGIYLGGDSTRDALITENNLPNGVKLTGAGGIGDFNGDGIDDFAVSMTDSSESRVFVVYGKTGFSGTLDTNYLKDPLNAMEINVSSAFDDQEIEISRIGDFNGDGYDDFAIGVSDLNGTAAGDGGFYMVYGRPNTASGPNVHVGTGGNDTLGDGGAANAVLRGGAGSDILRINNTNFLQIDGGTNPSAGPDVLVTEGIGNALNFSNVNFERMSGIETIQYGGADQTITLTLENLFNLLKTSDDGILRITDNGTTGSTLVLSDGNGTDNYSTGNTTDITAFLNDGAGGSTNVTHNTGSAGFDTFVIGGYKLLIDTSIAVDVQ